MGGTVGRRIALSIARSSQVPFPGGSVQVHSVCLQAFPVSLWVTSMNSSSHPQSKSMKLWWIGDQIYLFDVIARNRWILCNQKPLDLSWTFPKCVELELKNRLGALCLFTGGRNLPRSLLVTSSDCDGGVFAVPTTLPPNSSRHLRMFSPNKEAELALRQQLDSISVSVNFTFQSKRYQPRGIINQRQCNRLIRSKSKVQLQVCALHCFNGCSAHWWW